MTKYREIIRLTGLGFSQRNIMASCGVSQKTVVKVQSISAVLLTRLLSAAITSGSMLRGHPVTG